MFGEKYCMSKFASKSDMESAIMSDSKLSDIEKLVMVFRLNQDDIRKQNIQLHYALLAVADGIKKSRSMPIEELG